MKTRADWLNENAYRAFPFVEDSSGVCTDGVVMPDWVLVDVAAMILTGNSSKVLPDHFMEVVSFRVDIVNLVAREDGGDTQKAIIPQVKIRINHPDATDSIRSFDILMSAIYGAGEGLIVPNGWISQACRVFFISTDSGNYRESYLKTAFASPADFENPSPGTDADSFYNIEHVLETPRPILDTRCIYRPGGFGISHLFGNGSAPVADNKGRRKVFLENGYNTTLGISGGRVVLDIFPGAGLGSECPEPDPSSQGYGIFYINGQHIDSNGNFTFYAGPGIKIEEGGWNDIPGITISPNSTIDSMLGRT